VDQVSAEAVIAAFAANPPPLPPKVVKTCRRLVADTLQVGGAGASTLEAKRLAGRAAPGSARLLGGGSASPADAAFANGFAIHCLEWDPVHEGAVVHALSVVTAALLALADEQDRVDQSRLTTAIATGVEIAAGLGISATGPMRFFRPATAGVIGAAIAGGHLTGLGEDRFLPLMGLAYSFAGGTMQAHVEGSIALPLQIAAASRAAVTAVTLARDGFDGPRAALSGRFGYGELIEPIALEPWLEGLGARWLIEGVSIKPWPSGRASHGALGALAEIFRDGVQPSDIKAVRLEAPPLIIRLIGRPWQDGMSPAYARLCLPFLCALMLRDRRIDPRLFNSASFENAELRALGATVTWAEIELNDQNAMIPQRLTIELAGGQRVVDIPVLPGSPAAPLAAEQAADRAHLLKELGAASDARLFDDPWTYMCERQ
jgi:2-methylcitrate dehydratase PrpD